MPPEPRRDRLERLTNLVLVLLDAPGPLSLRQITDRVEGYPESRESVRQAFERDKRALRDLGIPVRNVALGTEDQVGYVIDPSDYYLPELDLDEAEAQALSFAVAAVQLGGNAGRDALSALGHGPGAAPVAPVAVLPALPALGIVHEALKQNALLGFSYHGRQREVEPYGLMFRQAAWYLVARDRSVASGDGAPGAIRTFRVDRFESHPSLGQAGLYEVPDGFDLGAEIHLLPFSAEADEPVPVAEMEVDARLSRQVTALVPDSAVVAWRPDGGVVLTLAVKDEVAFVSFVAGLGDTAVVRGPAELRDAVVGRLGEMAAAPPPATGADGPKRAEPAGGRSVSAVEAGDSDVPRPSSERGGTPAGTTPSGRRRKSGASSVPVAGERLRRLLAVLVHLARVGEAPIGEIARRFDMDEKDLVHDLELAACCGVPPYTPDQLIELVVDGDRVTAFGLGHLSKPRRLTPEEGFALAAAGTALCEVTGADEENALRSALAKLEEVLGESRFRVELGTPAHLGRLREAVERHERVELDYVSSTATEPMARQVDPYQVVLREGRFYLDGWCHLAGGLRRFQVDRVQAVRATGTVFDPPAELDEALSGPDAFIGGPGAVRARVAFPAESELGAEPLAAAPIERLEDGRLVTDVVVGDAEGWFGRTLLRLGPGTEVLAPPELREAGRRAALRALSRYEEERPDS